MIKAKITGFGACLPKTTRDNNYYSSYLDTSHEWIYSRSGIENRHIADSESLTDLATNAAREAIENAKLKPEDIDIIIVATSTPDNAFPSCATRVHGNLKMKESAQAFDVNAACNGFIYCLFLAKLYLKEEGLKNILIVGSDIMSKLTDKNDRSTVVLFGDGAGAAIISKTDEECGFLSTSMSTEGEKYEYLYTDKNEEDNNNCIKMRGNEIFKNAVIRMSESLQESVSKAGLTLDDIDLIFPHQANIRILQSIGNRLGIDNNKIVSIISKHANTSAASIPLAMHHAFNTGMLEGKKYIAFCGFGAGFSWGSIVMKIS